MEFCLLNKDEYIKFSEKHPYRNFLNLVESLETKKYSGWKIEFVGVKSDGEILAATALTSISIMRFYRYYYAQRGFLVDYRDEELLKFFVSKIKAFAKKNKALYLKVDPYIIYKERDNEGALVEGGEDNSYVIDALKQLGFRHKGFTVGYDDVSQARWLYSLYIDGRSEDEIYKQFDEQTRWSINKTVKQGIKIRELPLEEIDIYTKMMDETAERRGFPGRSHDFYKKFTEIYGDRCKLLLAYLDLDEYLITLDEEKMKLNKELESIEAKLLETPNNKKTKNKKRVTEEAIDVNMRKCREAGELKEKHGNILNMASACFTVYDNEIVYLFSGTDNRFRGYNAPYAIQWWMIRYAIKNGINRYNFYGISGDFNKESPDYGVYGFKKGFNGVVEELIGDFIMPIRPLAFSMYQKLKPGLI